MTQYEVYIADSDITLFDGIEEARDYIKSRGYTKHIIDCWCDHPSEMREYYVREDEDIDEDYCDGYAPCITPIEDADDDD